MSNVCHNLLQRLEHAKNVINQCKLDIVTCKIKCETAISQWIETIQNKDEHFLNDKLRQIAHLKEKLIASSNGSIVNDNIVNGINWPQIEQNVACCLMNIDDLKLQSLALFENISVDWLELSLDLQNNVNQLKSENQALSEKLENIENETKQQCNRNTIKYKTMFEHLQQQHNKMKDDFCDLKQHYDEINQKLEETEQKLENKTKTLQLNILVLFYALNHTQDSLVLTLILFSRSKNTNMNACMVQFCQESQVKLKELKLFLLRYCSQSKHFQNSHITLSSPCITPTTCTNGNLLKFTFDDCVISSQMQNIYSLICDCAHYNTKLLNYFDQFFSDMKKEQSQLIQKLNINFDQNEQKRNHMIDRIVSEQKLNIEKNYKEKLNKLNQSYKIEVQKIDTLKRQELKEQSRQFTFHKQMMNDRFKHDFQMLEKKMEDNEERSLSVIKDLKNQIVKLQIKHSNDLNEKLSELREMHQNEIIQYKEKYTIEKQILSRKNDKKLRDLKEQLISQNKDRINAMKAKQSILENEIDTIKDNVRVELQRLKRFKPYYTVHVPIVQMPKSQNGNNNINQHATTLNEPISYQKKLRQYLMDQQEN